MCWTLTPHLSVKGVQNAIRFYKEAFGAVEVARTPAGPRDDGLHCELQVNGSTIYVSDSAIYLGESPQTLGGTSVVLHLHVPDAGTAISGAVAAGATLTWPLQEIAPGHRYGRVCDPFGHIWAFYTSDKKVKADQMSSELCEFLKSIGPAASPTHP